LSNSMGRRSRAKKPAQNMRYLGTQTSAALFNGIEMLIVKHLIILIQNGCALLSTYPRQARRPLRSGAFQAKSLYPAHVAPKLLTSGPGSSPGL